MTEMCASSVVCSPMSATSFQLLGMSDTTPGERDAVYSRPSFTRYQTPSRTPTSLILPAIPRTPSSSRTRVRTVLFQSPASPTEEHQEFDILSHLPPEIAIKILSNLPPEELCSVCKVCRSWGLLAQNHNLWRRRIKYLQDKREEYLQSKENYVPGTHTPQGTQRPPSSQRSATRQMTIAQSPLNVIQPKSVRRGSITMSPAHSLNYTPGPAYLLEDVKRLTIDEGGSAAIDVRRQLLFSDFEPPSPQVRPSRLQNLVSRHDSETTVGKKANKSRLRRL